MKNFQNNVDKQEKKETSNSENNENENENENNTNVIISKPNTKHIKWSAENELIMVEWCDIAQCYKWLHTRCHKKLAALHAWFTIPAIALSTVSGTASFAQTSLPTDAQLYAPMAIGTINIMIGISTTIQQYLKISELNELHRVSGLLWDKFSRNIRIELAKDPDERMDAGHFLKICRQEFDRLMETSPSIDQSVISEFNRTFRGKETEEQKEEFMKLQQRRFDELRKPDICDIIISSNESRHTWYKDPERIKKMNSETALDLDIGGDIENQNQSLKDPMQIIPDFVGMGAANHNDFWRRNKVPETKGGMREDEVRTHPPTMKRNYTSKVLSIPSRDTTNEIRRNMVGETSSMTREVQTPSVVGNDDRIVPDATEMISEGRRPEDIDAYIAAFEESVGRKPFPDEIKRNMREIGYKDIQKKITDLDLDESKEEMDTK
jgi:hypothetical protein